MTAKRLLQSLRADGLHDNLSDRYLAPRPPRQSVRDGDIGRHMDVVLDDDPTGYQDPTTYLSAIADTGLAVDQPLVAGLR